MRSTQEIVKSEEEHGKGGQSKLIRRFWEKQDATEKTEIGEPDLQGESEAWIVMKVKRKNALRVSTWW